MAKSSTVLLYLVAVCTFGLLVPWIKGLDFLDPLLIIPYTCLAWIFTAPLMVRRVDDRRPPGRMELIVNLSRAASFGWGSSALILAMGLAVVNVSHWHGELLFPEPTLLAASLGLGLSGAWVVAAGGALMRLKGWTPASVRLVLRIFLVMALLAFALTTRLLPEAIALQLTSEALPARLAMLTILMIAGAILLVRSTLSLCQR